MDVALALIFLQSPKSLNISSVFTLGITRRLCNDWYSVDLPAPLTPAIKIYFFTKRGSFLLPVVVFFAEENHPPFHKNFFVLLFRLPVIATFSRHLLVTCYLPKHCPTIPHYLSYFLSLIKSSQSFSKALYSNAAFTYPADKSFSVFCLYNNFALIS